MKSFAWPRYWGWNVVFAIILLAIMGFYSPSLRAQTVQNLYMAGGSYNPGASPSIAGSALYAHQVSADTAPGLYAFSLIDALPSNTKPFTVTTNVGAGIAQKVLTIDGVDILVPTAIGISWTGTNTGWAWTTGAGAPIRVKPNWYVMPTVRVLKSSIGGAGYQPIVGVLFGWGK